MLTEKDRIDTLIRLFLDHQISDQQLQELQDWVHAKPENKAYLVACQKIELLTATQQKQKYNSEQAYQLFVQKQLACNRQKPQVIRWQRYLPYAAAVLLFVLAGSLHHIYRVPSVPQVISYRVEVPNGSRAKFYLPDSSEVWLNAGSNLECSSAYGEQSRTVKLKGEAFFKVAKKQDIPFIVQTDSVDIQVYGTSFNVRNFTDMSAIKVTLLEGSVALQLKSEVSPFFLKPLEELTYVKEGKHITIETIEHSYSDWRNGELHFDTEPLCDIIQVLERQYDVQIKIANPQLLKNTFYGGFTANQSIKEIIQIICFGMNIDYSVTDNTYIIH